MIIRRNEWKFLLTLLWSSTIWNFLRRLSSFLPDETRSFKKTFSNNAPVFQIAIALNTNSAFTGSCTENLFWYQQFGLRQVRILRGGLPIVDFDADNSCLYGTIRALNFQDDITSITIDKFIDQYVLVFALTSMQYAIENCHYPELVGEPLKLKLNFTFPLEHVTELVLSGERISSVAVDKFGVVGNLNWIMFLASKYSTVSPLLKYRYRGSFPSDYVPILDNDTFVIFNTQLSNMQGEHWILIANSGQILYFADSLGRKRYSLLKRQYEQMMPEPLQTQPNVCGFSTIYAAFHLLKIAQEEITGVHDVNVLSFKSNCM